MADEYYSGAYTGAEIDAAIAAAMAAMPRTEAEAALAGKQATLTTAQQAAVDSGITSAKVTQYDKDSAATTVLVDSGSKNVMVPISVLGTVPTGITITRDSDGTIHLSGTPTANGNIAISELMTGLSGCVVSGCPEHDHDTTPIDIQLLRTDTLASVAIDTGSGANINYDGEVRAIIYVRANKTYDNLTFKPMVCNRDLWNVSHKYVPYRAASNSYSETKSGQSASFDNIIRFAAKQAGYPESSVVGFSFMAYSDVSNEYIYCIGQFKYNSFIQKKWIETTTLSATTNNVGTVVVSQATGTLIRAVVTIF